MGQHDTTTDARVGAEGFREVTTAERTVRLLDIAVSALSLGEHLLIWRKRNGLTQPEAAAFLGMSRKKYEALEREDTVCKLKTMPALDELNNHEVCLILRRRSSWTIPQCAEQAGVSRYWYNLMEQGKAPCDRLIEYWAE